MTFAELAVRFGTGHILKVSKITESYDNSMFRERYGEEATPLFLINETGGLVAITAGSKIDPQPGQRLISLVHGESDAPMAIEV